MLLVCCAHLDSLQWKHGFYISVLLLLQICNWTNNIIKFHTPEEVWSAKINKNYWMSKVNTLPWFRLACILLVRSEVCSRRCQIKWTTKHSPCQDLNPKWQTRENATPIAMCKESVEAMIHYQLGSKIIIPKWMPKQLNMNQRKAGRSCVMHIRKLLISDSDMWQHLDTSLHPTH
jgi:hypothetical protein